MNVIKKEILDYLWKCLGDIEIPANKSEKILKLIGESFNKNIAPAEVNAWIKLELGIKQNYFE